MSVAFFKELALFVVSESSRICPCTSTAWRSIRAEAIRSGTTRVQDISAMTTKNKMAKGRSTYASTVADDIKERTLSKPWMLLAKEPTEGDLSSFLMSSTCSIISPESFTFVFTAARSTRYPLVTCITKSAVIITNTPIAITHRDSTALLGTTLL